MDFHKIIYESQQSRTYLVSICSLVYNKRQPYIFRTIYSKLVRWLTEKYWLTQLRKKNKPILDPMYKEYFFVSLLFFTEELDNETQATAYEINLFCNFYNFVILFKYLWDFFNDGNSFSFENKQYSGFHAENILQILFEFHWFSKSFGNLFSQFYNESSAQLNFCSIQLADAIVRKQALSLRIILAFQYRYSFLFR